ncbi:MAG: HPF/RaiA family ribosome-associated protein [Patescibacteria group bacterium]
MKIIFFSKALSSAEEKQLREYVDKKMKSLSRLLSHFAEDSVQLQITTERFEKNNAFQVEMILTVPQKKVVGKEASHTIQKAVDLAKDRIMVQLRKHEEVRREHRSIKKVLDPVHQAESQYMLSDQEDLY